MLHACCRDCLWIFVSSRTMRVILLACLIWALFSLRLRICGGGSPHFNCILHAALKMDTGVLYCGHIQLSHYRYICCEYLTKSHPSTSTSLGKYLMRCNTVNITRHWVKADALSALKRFSSDIDWTMWFFSISIQCMDWMNAGLLKN